MTQEPSNATRWTLIVRAQGSGAEQRAALEELLRHYEKFVVWLIRQHGYPPDTTPEELKQEFFEGVLRRKDIGKLDRSRGTFRGWLGLAVRRFLANEWDKWRAAKAGRQGTSPMAFDPLDVTAPPDDVCTREFARHVLSRTLELLRREATNPTRFDALARFLPGAQLDPVELAPLAESLGMSRTALARAVCVLRARYRELLRQAIRDLIDPEPPSDDPPRAAALAIDEELNELRRHFWS
jgi:RNA polymerase sigma-70 factor (ECF subfamily)